MTDPFVVQFVDENLGNSSYLIGSTASGRAVVVDPPRHVEPHVFAAERRGVKIEWVLETHLHNDFVSGAREIAAKTGATIAMSRNGDVEFDHRPLSEGDRISLGEAELVVMETPGHTPEHLAFRLTSDGAKAPPALFSGGALIVGGAARTDLLGAANTDRLTRQLFETIHGKFANLPAEVTVYPTHGAGSFCAAPRSAERITTIGRERATNPLVQAATVEQFTQLATAGLPAYPSYFREMRPINRRGPRLLRDLPAITPLAASAVRAWMEGGGAVLDVRSPEAFWEAHIPGAYGITVDAPLTTWAGWLIPFGTPLVLVAGDPAEREGAVAQLVTIGYDDIRGYLDGGMPAWRSAGFPIERVPVLHARDLRTQLTRRDAPLVLDVREDSEWDAGHLPHAVHIRSGRLPTDELTLPRDTPIVVHCAHSARSTAGISVLARRGYHHLTILEGGFMGWRAAGYEVVRERDGDG